MAFEYDVAFSFRAQDEATAVAIGAQIGPRLKTFIYSEHQKELAATNGVISLPSVYAEQARTVVVLYRDGWGDGGWTKPEQTAIQGRAMGNKDVGWDFLLMIAMEHKAPSWMPITHLWLDFQRYGIPTACAVIERHVERAGGAVHDPTVEEMLEARALEQALEHQRLAHLAGNKGVQFANEQAALLFQDLASHHNQDAGLFVSVDPPVRSDQYGRAVLGGNTLTVEWHGSDVVNALMGAYLEINYWHGRPPSFQGTSQHARQTERYMFDVDAAFQPIWTVEGRKGRKVASPSLPTKQLVKQCIKRLMEIPPRR